MNYTIKYSHRMNYFTNGYGQMRYHVLSRGCRGTSKALFAYNYYCIHLW